MKDPHIHVEHDQFMGHALMRAFIAEVTGLAVSAPKTVRTGCNRRRPYAMTSRIPASVTCLACRDYAAAWHAEQAASCASLREWMIAEPDGFAGAALTPGQLAAMAAEHEAAAAQFGSTS